MVKTPAQKTNLRRLLRYRGHSLRAPSGLKGQWYAIVEKWVEKSGEEWTVKRIKTLKAFIIQLASGTPTSPPPWFATNPDGSLAGVSGEMVKYAVSSVRNFGRSLSLINIYTAFVAQDVTETQIAKFIGAVESGPEPASVSSYEGQFLHGCEVMSYTGVLRGEDVSPVRLEDLPRGKMSPLPDGKFYPIEMAPNIVSAEDADYDLVELAMSTVQGAFMPFLTMGEGLLDVTYDKLYAGILLCKQEPGYKLRGVAAPNLVWQASLFRLYKLLKRVLMGITQDCTFEQEKGVTRTVQALQSGKTVYSLDLSNATDLFPLSLQLLMLENMGIRPEDILVFRKLFRLPWRSEIPDHREVTWSRGQPLGTYPSFFLFALAHHAVLASCGAGSDDYSLLGDDVVIYNADVAERYIEVMTSIGCKFGAEKCLTSNLLAEFAGKVIHSTGYFTQYKWKAPNDENFLDVARALGPSCLATMPRRYAEVIKLLAEIPAELGGLGWNPDGLPYSVLWRKWSWLEEAKAPTERLTRVDKQFSQLLANYSRSDISVAYLRSSVQASVAELEQRFSEILPTGWVSLIEAFSRNLGLIDEDWPYASREPFITNQFRNWAVRLGLQ